VGFLLDIEAGADLSHTLLNTTTTRIADVDQLQGSDLHAMLWDALAVLGNLSVTDPPLTDIVLGAAHPSVPGIVVTELNPTPVASCARARVEIVYARPRFEFTPPEGADGADTKMVRYFGRARQVTRDPKDGSTELTVLPPNNAGTDYSNMPGQTKTITVNESLGVLTFNRTERSVPTARMRDFQNTVNVAALGTLGAYPAKTLYCNTIQADTQDQGGLYLVRYEFIYNAAGHTVEYKWERPPLNVLEYDAGSRKELEPYNTKDFSLLGLDFND